MFPDIIASHELRLLQHVFEASKLTNRLVPVTGGVLALGTLESLAQLGAYIYLDSQSGEADLARQVLLQTPLSCPDSWSGTSGPTDPTLKEAVRLALAADIAGDTAALRRLEDEDRLHNDAAMLNNPLRAQVHGTLICSLWGNDRLAFALVLGVYERPQALGQELQILALRNRDDGWHLLATTPFGGPRQELYAQRSKLAQLFRGDA